MREGEGALPHSQSLNTLPHSTSFSHIYPYNFLPLRINFSETEEMKTGYITSVTTLPSDLIFTFKLSNYLLFSIRRLFWEARASQQKPIVCLISRHFPAGRPEITAVNIEPTHSPHFHQTSLLSIFNPQSTLSLSSILSPPTVHTFTRHHCCQY